MSKDWFVYLLRCSDGTFYTGITVDLDRRMKQHADGSGSKYVASRGFDSLLFAISAPGKSVASKIEYNVKQLPKFEKMEFFREHPLRVSLD